MCTVQCTHTYDLRDDMHKGTTKQTYSQLYVFVVIVEAATIAIIATAKSILLAIPLLRIVFPNFTSTLRL